MLDSNFTNNSQVIYKFVDEYSTTDWNREITIHEAHYEQVLNLVTENGGAIYVVGEGIIIKNSNFKDIYTINAGAIYAEASNSRIEGCSFERTSAKRGGSIYIKGDSNVISSSSFTGNYLSYNETSYLFVSMEYGELYPKINTTNYVTNTVYEAVYINGSDVSVEKSRFENLVASVTEDKTNVMVTAIFRGNDNLINAIYIIGDYTLSDVEYWGAEGLTNTDAGITDLEAGQNITIKSDSGKHYNR